MKNIITGLFLLFSTASLAQNHHLIDKKATRETQNLYNHLFEMLDKGIMFGHQDDLAYGVNWRYVDGRSDVYEVVKDYPAVFGWDLGHIEHNADNNLDTVPFKKIREYIRLVYDKGGINTLSWHMDNPVTLGYAWDHTSVVKDILPGGKYNKRYRKWLKNGAKFIKSLKGSDGKRIPVLFRPYHELNGNWFWWGSSATTPEEYQKLWKYTINYMMNKMHVHNIIYVYNTNSFNAASEFMQRYPGDDYADVISFDAYQFTPKNANDSLVKASLSAFKSQVKNSLRILDSVAVQHHKLPTFAETGYVTIPVPDWWTQTLWDAVKDYKISYFLVWRNYGWQVKEKTLHYYAPYAGHPSAADFKKLYDKPRTLFLKDIQSQNLYQ